MMLKIKPNYRIKTVKKRPSMLLRGAAIGATILALKFAPQFFATEARIAKINAEIEAQNKIQLVERQKGPPIVPLEKRYKKGIKQIFNPNEGGNCSAYATRAAKKFFNKNYEYAHAWDLEKANKLVFKSKYTKLNPFSGIGENDLLELIKCGKLKPGTLVGTYYTESPTAIKHPEYDYTHIMLYAGDGVFWHNIKGPKQILLEEIYNPRNEKRTLYPVSVIIPRQGA